MNGDLAETASGAIGMDTAHMMNQNDKQIFSMWQVEIVSRSGKPKFKSKAKFAYNVTVLAEHHAQQLPHGTFILAKCSSVTVILCYLRKR